MRLPLIHYFKSSKSFQMMFQCCDWSKEIVITLTIFNHSLQLILPIKTESKFIWRLIK